MIGLMTSIGGSGLELLTVASHTVWGPKSPNVGKEEDPRLNFERICVCVWVCMCVCVCVHVYVCMCV